MVNFDEFGPEKILEVYNPKVGMRGFVVIDNTAFGPGKGGIRMTPTVSVEEVSRLARAMTWKTALAELPFGGAKSGIVADPKQISLEKKKAIVEAFSEALKIVSPSIYVAAPDINTAEREMEWFTQINGNKKSCTGKPVSMGGLPHELGSTGFGVYHATMIAAEFKGIDISNATFSVEGFGNVGWFTAKFLTEKGAKLVSVSDSQGVLHNQEGIDFEKLVKVKKEKGSVVYYKPGHKEVNKSIIENEADILITAAVPDLISISDAPKVRAKIIVEGSNIPITIEVEELLHKKGILVIPDIIANAGGVISSYVEYRGGNEKEMFKLVEKKIVKNTQLVLGEAQKKNDCLPRICTLEIAKERLRKQCEICKK